jgi:hypothetical protein
MWSGFSTFSVEDLGVDPVAFWRKRQDCSRAARDCNTGFPAWSAPSSRERDRLGSHPAARNQPGDHRVRVPHLAYVELVATPNRSRHGRHQGKKSMRLKWIFAQSPRAFDRLGDVWDDAVTPATDLVAKNPKAPRPARSDRAFRDDASLRTVGITNWSLLDHESPLGYVHHEPGVIEVASRPSPQSGRYGFVDAPVEPHGMTSCA